MGWIAGLTEAPRKATPRTRGIAGRRATSRRSAKSWVLGPAAGLLSSRTMNRTSIVAQNTVAPETRKDPRMPNRAANTLPITGPAMPPTAEADCAVAT